MKILKSSWFIIFCLAFWLLIVFSGNTEAHEAFPIVGIDTKTMEAMRKDPDWMQCGQYFAAIDTKNGKKIYFNFAYLQDKETPLTALIILTSHVFVVINEELSAPVVGFIEILKNPIFILNVNKKDYMIGLPCFANGRSV